MISAPKTRKQSARISSLQPREVMLRNREAHEDGAQLIDDDNGKTIAAASSRDKDIVAQKVTKTEKSKLVGATIARKATELGIQKVVFDSFPSNETLGFGRCPKVS